VTPAAFRKMRHQTFNIEPVKSLALVHNLIRKGISLVAHGRNILPRKCFEDCKFVCGSILIICRDLSD